MRFEWDAAKDRANQAKHDGLDFETAARVFDDPEMLLLKDRVVAGEQRWHAIGAVMSAVVLVVHVYREDDENGEERIRIISAREASKRERGIYFQQAAR
ncbi:MAG: BrnT family toxin [Bryobacterales bacterium]|nr:BrnT family toxin [Bryobacterales bacterium]